MKVKYCVTLLHQRPSSGQKRPLKKSSQCPWYNGEDVVRKRILRDSDFIEK
jgi:hypothetical protein